MNKIDIDKIVLELVDQIKNGRGKYIFETYIKQQNFNSKIRKEIGDKFFDAIRFLGLVQKKGLGYLEGFKNELENYDLKKEDLTDIFGLKNVIAEQVYNSLEDINDFKLYLKRAPLTIRVNYHKISREILYNNLSVNYNVKKTEVSPYGIYFNEHINVRDIDEFKKGMFEIQDEASQLITLLVNPKPKESILDLCAGTGGKSIALQSLYYNTLNIDAYDISDKRLNVFKTRGNLLNLRFNFPKKIKENYYDKVLIDAPCSGSGTVRRDVDNLIQLNGERLNELVKTQYNLLKKGLIYTKKYGYIIYVTCSFLKDENEYLVERFAEEFKNSVRLIPLSEVLDRNILKYFPSNLYFKTSPRIADMDSFFGVIFQKL